MKINKTYQNFLKLFYFFPILGQVYGIDLDFVAVSDNYYKEVSEDTDGTFQIAISGTGGGAWGYPFYIKTDYTTSDGDVGSTAQRWPGWNSSYGQGYREDFGSLTAEGSGGASTSGTFNIIQTRTSSERYWIIYATGSGDGTYTFTLNVYQDLSLIHI